MYDINRNDPKNELFMLKQWKGVTIQHKYYKYNVV